MRRVLTFLSICASLSLAGLAHAGSYTVVACDAATEDGGAATGSLYENNSWTYSTTDPTTSTQVGMEGESCQTDGGFDSLLGMGTYDTLGAALYSSARSSWTFEAPPETTITNVVLDRLISTLAEPDWRSYGAYDGVNQDVVGPCVGCSSYGTFQGDYGDSSVSYGYYCVDDGGCIVGWTLHRVVSIIHSAKITLSESVAPALTVTSTTFDDPGYASGIGTVSFDASDAKGIKKAELSIDGYQGDTESFSCDYTYVNPCSDQTNQSLSWDASLSGEGAHTAKLVVTDAAGNETSSDTWSFTVASGANSNTATNPTTTTTTTPTTTTEQTTTTPTPTNPVAKSSPKLKITKSTYLSKKKRLTVSGTCSKLVEGKKLSLTFKPTKKSKSIHKKATCKSRKFKVSFKLRKKRHGSLTVSYVGSSTIEAQVFSRRI